MMHPYTPKIAAKHAAKKPELEQVAVTISVFTVMLAGAMFWPLVTDNMMFERTHATAWAMTLLATPAFYIFVRNYGNDARPLTNWWRLSWTAGWVMSLVHFYYGLGEMHAWDACSVFTRQGFLLAFTIFGLILVWGADVIMAWRSPGWAEDDTHITRIAFWWAFVAFFVSTVVFNNDAPSMVVGMVMTGTILVAVFQRIDAQKSWRDAFDTWVPAGVVGGLTIPVALYGPEFLGADTMTPSEIIALQAQYTIWPVLILGGVAAAIFVGTAPRAHWSWGWRWWSIGGYLAYLVHLYAGFWKYFGSISATLDHQGWLVFGANALLLVIWTISSVAAACKLRALWAHVGTMGALMILTIMSTYDRDTAVFWVGCFLAVVWAVVVVARIWRQNR